MAPKRGKGKSRASTSRPGPAKATRSTRKTEDAIPDVYQELLDEQARRSPEIDHPERPLKRRRVATRVQVAANEPSASEKTPAQSSPASSPPAALTKDRPKAKPVQTIEASSDSGSDDESDFGFEDVDLSGPAAASPSQAPVDDDRIADVSISVDATKKLKPPPTARQRAATSAEKATRLLTHKAHILCLLGHCMYVNTWCNDTSVQQHLHPLLSKKTLTYLRGKDDYTQFQRDRSFREGLEQASEVFRGHFKVNASGIRRAIWNDVGTEVGPDEDVESRSRHDLILAAREMEGSQDLANQLFCALLRSAGVDARLVCSLQTLPLSNAQPKAATPKKPAKQVMRAMPPNGDIATSDSNTEDNGVKGSSTIGKVPSARRRLGQPAFSAEKATPTTAPATRKKPVRKLDYPVFWVEAFNTAHQKWTPVDPIVTHTIGKPSKFEPPSSYAQNQMSYVIAFEDDGVARDVTRRYTKAYNAKTRRHRVEGTENGTQWLKKALRLFRRRGGTLDRDQTEDAELNQKEAREGLPANVQDFKDHPVYALERHLKRHEIIEPKREVGKVNAGTAAKPRMEPVYRRSDVLVCRSADKWYRLGREVQEGEAPIKHVPARNSRRGKSMTPEAEAEEAAGAGTTALYAYHQTEAYVAPPVVKGKVPRNAFGNLDIYVPSMVPPGGTHIRHGLAQQSAKILRIDYADAVTGFQFKGRHGTAIIQGAVVASENAEAVEAVIEGLQNEALEEESLARSSMALRMWKRFLTGLRIKERVGAYGTDGDGADVRREIDREVDEQEEIAEAGGFFAEEPVMPTAGRFSLVELGRAAKGTAKGTAKGKGKKRKEESESEEETEFSAAESEAQETSWPGRRSKRARRNVVQEEDEEMEGEEAAAGLFGAQQPNIGDSVDNEAGGGFLPDGGDGDMEGGGFVPEDASTEGDTGGAGGFIAEPSGRMGEEEGGSGGFLPDANDHEGLHGTEAVEDFGGGGFVPEDSAGDDHLAGGFMLEAEPSSTAAVPTVQTENDTALSGDATHSADTQTETIPMLHQNEQHDDNTALPREESLMMHGALPDEQLPAVATEVDVKQTIERPPAKNEGKAEGGEGEDSDHGSMISHDPEDEDAEPDWLESD